MADPTRPTPTQEEMDAHARGERRASHEHDGSPHQDPLNMTPPALSVVTKDEHVPPPKKAEEPAPPAPEQSAEPKQEEKASEAEGQRASYKTRRSKASDDDKKDD